MDCIFVKRDFMIVNSNDINNVKPTGEMYIQWCSV